MRMLGREPRTGTESLKIRYWRTGRYTPVNREQCLRLAGALELTEEEKRFLIQGYFDRSETVYDTPEKWNSAPFISGLRREENISGTFILQMLSTM